MEVGQRCIVATGYKPMATSDFVIRKRIAVVTKVNRKGFEIDNLKFDFNGRQKQTQQTGPNSVLSIAIPITYKEWLEYRTAKSERMKAKKSKIKELAGLEKKIAEIKKEVRLINESPISKLRKQTKL